MLADVRLLSYLTGAVLVYGSNTFSLFEESDIVCVRGGEDVINPYIKNSDGDVKETAHKMGWRMQNKT